MTLTDKEAEVLKDFLFRFRWTLVAYLKEAPRASHEVPYQRRMTDEERAALWLKLGFGSWED